MRKVKFLSMFLLLTLVISVSVGAAMSQESLPAQDDAQATTTPHPLESDLQPGVREFIANTYLAHTDEYPDPNEPVELLRLYLEGRQLLYCGRAGWKKR